MKGSIYARESKDDENSPPVENQIEIGKEWFKKNNVKLLGVYSDKGLSGGDWNRAGLNLMLNDIRRNHAGKVIWCFDEDRLARDTRLFITICDELHEKNMRLYSNSKGYVDMQSAGGRFTNTTLAAASEFYRKQIGEKVKKVYEFKKRKKDFKWGRPKKQVDEDIILRWHRKGLGLRTIAKKHGDVSYQTVKRVIDKRMVSQNSAIK